MMKAIGGYFELELPEAHDFPHSNGVLLNSGRNSLEYILGTLPVKPKKVWLPYYTCEVVLQPFKRLGIDVSFYNVNTSFEIDCYPDLSKNEYIVANNYFGIKDAYVANLCRIYGERLIIDCAQAFYMDEIPEAMQFYSPRKYFGVPDGGIAFTPYSSEWAQSMVYDESYFRCSHLIKRIDISSSEGYADFRNNSEILGRQLPKKMSKFTRRMLESIDYDRMRRTRRCNYKILDEALRQANRLKLPDQDSFACPMVYPFMTENKILRNKLIDNKIFVATYWQNVLTWRLPDTIEYSLANNILPLPIDQRYGIEDMARIISVIKETSKI